jgi:hypothetical protein
MRADQNSAAVMPVQTHTYCYGRKYYYYIMLLLLLLLLLLVLCANVPIVHAGVAIV